MIPDPASLSLLVLVFEWVGVSLNALLFFFLARSVRRTHLDYWALGWLCLSTALAALYLSLQQPGLERLQMLYFLGEYGFGYLLIAGCRNYVSGVRLSPRHLWAVLPAAALAFGLAGIESSFTVRFVGHAGAMAVVFGYALFELERVSVDGRPGPGLATTRVALALLAVVFLHYVFVYANATIERVPLPFAYTAFNSIFDLVLLTVLAFGMVVLALEDVRGELEQANRALRGARDRLETLVRQDPLTEALSRHAFQALVEERRSGGGGAPSGCVAVVDIDDLKQVNDRFGHPAGDTVIRAVASAIRSVVRAADPVFRWGGDEFLVVLPDVGEPEARQRLEELNPRLSGTRPPAVPGSLRMRVSFGVAPFSEAISLEKAIAAADEAMYRDKQERKALAGEGDAAAR